MQLRAYAKRPSWRTSRAAAERGGALTDDAVTVNGRVIEGGTPLDALADVGVKGDKIGVIAKQPITGKETINANYRGVATVTKTMLRTNVGSKWAKQAGSGR